MYSERHICGKRKKPTFPSTIAENKALYHKFEQDYARRYLAKLEAKLDIISFRRLLKILQEFTNKNTNIVDYYGEISNMLLPYSDLQAEFLTFLYPNQAANCGKLSEYLQIYQIKEFLFKLNLCFKRYPQRIKKITDIIFKLSTEKEVTEEMLRAAIIPLLKNNSFLIDSFLRLLPDEKPPESLFADNWEDINIYSTEPDSEELMHAPKLQMEHTNCLYKQGHCTSQDVTFINGRLFIQSGKMLKPARIIVSDADTDEFQKQADGIVKYIKGNKKLETTNNDSAFTESDEESGDNPITQRQKRKNKLVFRLFKKPKSDHRSKRDAVPDNTEEMEISDECNISDPNEICNNMNSTKTNIFQFSDDNAMTELIVNLNQSDSENVPNFVEKCLLPVPNLINSELISISSDSHKLSE